MTSADLIRPAGTGLAADTGRRGRPASMVPLTIAVCCAVIGLDQILHTTPATFAASPLGQVVHWAVDVVLAVPFAAAAIWAGGWLSGKLGAGLDRSGLFVQACVTTLVLAVLLVPG